MSRHNELFRFIKDKNINKCGVYAEITHSPTQSEVRFLAWLYNNKRFL